MPGIWLGRCKNPSLQGVCADSGYRKSYRKTFEALVQNLLKKTVEISARITSSWEILAKRWRIERIFAWLNHFRRLAKEYEIGVQPTKHNVMIPHSMLLIRRLD
ncbi:MULTISPECIES: transposase [Holospora]|uniref:Transposase IS4-like domain-containing protein n=2 Tax=Holospora TaxID=44747 RepID=A0A061JGI3_9PROT|nr:MULTISPECIES: transposase [Holospora]ETZ05150.1 hypothetical protein K737_300424 [Holospora undulata HU1]GAJ46801.1 hypothetical protein HE1_01143 [Holospora elegans E1]